MPGLDGDTVRQMMVSDVECHICPSGPVGAPGDRGPQGIQVCPLKIEIWRHPSHLLLNFFGKTREFGFLMRNLFE